MNHNRLSAFLWAIRFWILVDPIHSLPVEKLSAKTKPLLWRGQEGMISQEIIE